MINEEETKVIETVKEIKKEKNINIQFRGPQALADKFFAIAKESGNSNAETFEKGVSALIKLSSVKDLNVDLVGDINSLESHVSSIQSIFLNIIDKMECQKKGITQSGINDNKIYLEKIASIQIELENFEILNVEGSKSLANLNDRYKILSDDYDKLIESIKDKIVIAADYKEKNILLTAENLKFKLSVTELDLCKEELETLKADKKSHLDELTEASAKNEKLKKENSDLAKDYKLEIEKKDKQAIEENTFLDQKLQLEYNSKLFDQKLLQQNICDKSLKEQQKVFDEKQNLSDIKNKENSDEFYRRQNKFGDDIRAAYKNVDEAKAGTLALKKTKMINDTKKGIKINVDDIENSKGALTPLEKISKVLKSIETISTEENK